MNLTPPPQGDDLIITQFRPVEGQWELNDGNIKRIDPKTGFTILHNYCRHINTTPLEVYRYLIETMSCDVNVQDKDKNTPLHDALRYFKGGDIAVLTYLLTQKGINVNLKGQSGYTSLHWACEKINKLQLEIFKLLIETHGGDVNAHANNKDTPIHEALRTFNPNDGGDVIAHANNKDTPIHEALRTFNPNDGGDITALTYLITQKDVNVKGQYGNTILHRACMNINTLPLDIFKVLIETQGCDINVQNDYNNTPLHHSICYFDPNNGNNITVLHYLLTQKSVNFGIKGKKGHNLLHYACVSNLSESRDSVELNEKFDIILCQVVEVIVERCTQQVLDETTS